MIRSQEVVSPPFFSPPSLQNHFVVVIIILSHVVPSYRYTPIDANRSTFHVSLVSGTPSFSLSLRC